MKRLFIAILPILLISCSASIKSSFTEIARKREKHVDLPKLHVRKEKKWRIFVLEQQRHTKTMFTH